MRDVGASCSVKLSYPTSAVAQRVDGFTQSLHFARRSSWSLVDPVGKGDDILVHFVYYNLGLMYESKMMMSIDPSIQLQRCQP